MAPFVKQARPLAQALNPKSVANCIVQFYKFSHCEKEMTLTVQSIILKEQGESYTSRRYIDLKADFAFKRMFGQGDGRKVLIAFLNALLASDRQHPPIVSVELLNPELEREYSEDKKALLDLLAQTDSGTFIHIELQLLNQPHLISRLVYYWSRVYTKQLKKGQSYDKLNPTITILISNEDVLAQTGRYHTRFGLYEDQERFRLTDMLDIHVIELQKLLRAFTSGDADPWQDSEIRWLLLLAAVQGDDVKDGLIKQLEAIAMRSDEELFEAFERWESLSRDPKVWAKYELWHMAVMDEAAREADRLQLEQDRQRLETESKQLKTETTKLQSETAQLKSESAQLKSESAQLKSESAQLKSEKERLKLQLLQAGQNMLRSGMSPEEVSRITGLPEDELSNDAR
ncbi:Rpn family recombination-promoting nuclease/putative transposase [Paenibacillus sp. IB182496]|uniref:Rpn family recombination-promoting nuclease/putative transposase n=1 Tax=Paenibacillus sabuli TaxID=2772509 RepID=A0A927BQH5_9BACL|nr:Rpn family recombination-promoting nuclease/putative transposase [Paenibacillus sabuli]MBD2844873.1 Rpn family recombination-promoting nuclease/putative transposase [Paenibacillus sabuli]